MVVSVAFTQDAASQSKTSLYLPEHRPPFLAGIVMLLFLLDLPVLQSQGLHSDQADHRQSDGSRVTVTSGSLLDSSVGSSTSSGLTHVFSSRFKTMLGGQVQR